MPLHSEEFVLIAVALSGHEALIQTKPSAHLAEIRWQVEAKLGIPVCVQSFIVHGNVLDFGSGITISEAALKSGEAFTVMWAWPKDREGLLKALEEIGHVTESVSLHAAAVSHLLENDDPEVRACAIMSLSWMGDAGAEHAGAVAALLSDKEYRVRKAVCHALPWMGHAATEYMHSFCSCIAEGSNRLNWVGEYAELAVKILLSSSDDVIRASAFTNIATLDDVAVLGQAHVFNRCRSLFLRGLSDRISEVRKAACEAFIRLLEAEGAAHLIKFNRWCALMELMHFDVERQGTNTVSSSCDSEVCLRLCQAMEKIGACHAKDADFKSGDIGYLVRKSSLEAFASLYSIETSQQVGSRYSHFVNLVKSLTDTQWQVRLAAVEAMCATLPVGQRHADKVAKLLNDENESVRSKAHAFFELAPNIQLTQKGAIRHNEDDCTNNFGVTDSDRSITCESSELYGDDRGGDEENADESRLSPAGKSHLVSTLHSCEPRNSEGRRARRSKKQQARKQVEQAHRDRERDKETREKARKEARDRKRASAALSLLQACLSQEF